jgi:signal transduction histidine kinase
VLFALTVLLEDGPGDSVLFRPPGDVAVAALVLFAVASAALYWRRRAPLLVLVVALAAWVPLLGSDFSSLGGQAIVGLYSAGRYGRHDRWAYLGLAGALAVLTLDGVTGPVPWGEVAFGVLVFLGAWYTGRHLRLRVERREQQLREQQAEARRIVAEERTRIARELHDVVAHRVSLMTVQAGAAKTVAADDPQAALRAMGAVEAAGRQALDELRHLLGVLRPEAQLDATGPQPCLADLPQLIEQTRQAGLHVTFRADGLPPGLPARVELSAYRIIQECLTNVVKHAGPDARTEVRVTSDGTCLVVDVTDDGRGATVLPGSSHGIIGMRERALLLGGSLDVGPRAGGGFRVLAQLPIKGVPA